ncbi:unnamed protein product, partial [Ectocarpus sp. 12 AP-2014]
MRSRGKPDAPRPDLTSHTPRMSPDEHPIRVVPLESRRWRNKVALVVTLCVLLGVLMWVGGGGLDIQPSSSSDEAQHGMHTTPNVSGRGKQGVLFCTSTVGGGEMAPRLSSLIAPRGCGKNTMHLYGKPSTRCFQNHHYGCWHKRIWIRMRRRDGTLAQTDFERSIAPQPSGCRKTPISLSIQKALDVMIPKP